MEKNPLITIDIIVSVSVANIHRDLFERPCFQKKESCFLPYFIPVFKTELIGIIILYLRFLLINPVLKPKDEARYVPFFYSGLELNTLPGSLDYSTVYFRDCLVLLLRTLRNCGKYLWSRNRPFTSNLLSGFPVALFVMVSTLLPVVIILAMTCLRMVNPKLEEAAKLSAPWPLVFFKEDILPVIRPGIFLAGLIVFILAFGEFGAPSSLRFF